MGAAARSGRADGSCSAALSTASCLASCTILYHRSCWTVGDYCYLQDLFVAEGARKAGLGRALIEAVYPEARAAGASRVHWLTHETNATARALVRHAGGPAGLHPVSQAVLRRRGEARMAVTRRQC